jgi:hypothetical protein
MGVGFQGLDRERALPNGRVPGERKTLTQSNRVVNFNRRSTDENVEMTIRRRLRPYLRERRRYSFWRVQQLELVIGIGPIFTMHYLVLHRIKIYIDL